MHGATIKYIGTGVETVVVDILDTVRRLGLLKDPTAFRILDVPVFGCQKERKNLPCRA
jgi:hypothetical protein